MFRDTGVAEAGWRDVIVDPEHADDMFRRFTVEQLAGDDPSDELIDMALHNARFTTEQRHKRLGHWNYWNHGRSHETRETHLARAERDLTVRDDEGRYANVPCEVLEAGLLYLNGTVSGVMSSSADAEYAELRREHDFPPHEEARAMQLAALRAAMERVTALLWGT